MVAGDVHGLFAFAQPASDARIVLKYVGAASMTAFGWSGTGILTLRARAGDVLRGAIRSVTVNVP